MVGFIDRHSGGEKAILVHINFRQDDFLALQHEFEELVAAAGIKALGFLTGTRDSPLVAAFLGKGKQQELADMVHAHCADVVIFNHTLTPGQARNLEKLCDCKVVDRTELILDIFAARARTFEGRLQVELAQLQHLSTRLVRGWTHLERQKGGIGLRGPGETQLETDRRLLAVRIKRIKARLQKVHLRREQGRRLRQRRALPTVSLVGYTNAGKSTLFNMLTEAEVFADSQLFATLDPTYRQIDLAGLGSVVLVDTVGFIRNLPHDLVEAFHATLEEAALADLCCHVIDITNPEQEVILESVHSVLGKIGAASVPQLLVYNKIDAIAGTEPQIIYDANKIPVAVKVAAIDGSGLDLLKQAITERLASRWVRCEVTIPYSQAAARAWLYQQQAVLSEQNSPDSGCWLLKISLSAHNFKQLQLKGVTL